MSRISRPARSRSRAATRRPTASSAKSRSARRTSSAAASSSASPASSASARNGVDFSFTEPYFLGYRMAAGIDLFSKFSDQTQYSRYENRMTGGQLRLGLPFTEEFTRHRCATRCTSRISTIPNDVQAALQRLLGPDPRLYGAQRRTARRTACFCEGNGEASLAIKESQGETLTSLAGLTFNYNTLDSTKDPRNGFYAEVKTDFAGLGGDSRYFRATGDARYYRELFEDIVGIARVQGGQITGFDGGDDGRRAATCASSTSSSSARRSFAASPPTASARATSRASTASANAIGGTTYFGGSLEVQFPIFGLPRELGLKGAVFADAGTLFGYKGPTHVRHQRQRHHRRLRTDAAARRSADRAAGMHPGARQQDDPLLGRRLASCGRRRSARSASTTPMRSRRKRASSRRTASGSAATGRRRSASRAARASRSAEGASRRRPRLMLFMTESRRFLSAKPDAHLASGGGDGECSAPRRRRRGAFASWRRSP